MNIDIKVKFSSRAEEALCFRHAVQVALEGKDVIVEAGDFNSDYYMGTIYCVRCNKERKG